MRPHHKTFKFVLILLMIVFNTKISSAFDPWSERSRLLAEDYHHPAEDRFVSTVHGTCYGPNVSWRDLPVKAEDYKVRSKEMASNWMPVKIGLQRDHRGKIIKAPVIFVIPGAFNNLSHRQPRALMYQFSRLGYHVAVFPNPWGTEYISHNPAQPTGSFLAEGHAIYQAIREVHTAFKKDDIIERDLTRVYGVSYGGFVAAMVAGLDSESENPVITVDTTSVSPPFHIGKTLLRLDELLKESSAYIGLDYYQLFKRFKDVCTLDLTRPADSSSLMHAKGLAASRGFHSELANSLGALERVKKWNTIPGRRLGWLSPSYRRWFRDLNFGKYYEKYAPQAAIDAFTEQGNLYYWIDKAQKNGFKGARVLVAQDDFLNDYTWSAEVEERGPETIVLENGGHYGFRSLFWYRQFINQTYFTDLPAQLER